MEDIENELIEEFVRTDSDICGFSVEEELSELDFDNDWDSKEGEYPILRVLDEKHQLENRDNRNH